MQKKKKLVYPKVTDSLQEENVAARKSKTIKALNSFFILYNTRHLLLTRLFN